MQHPKLNFYQHCTHQFYLLAWIHKSFLGPSNETQENKHGDGRSAQSSFTLRVDVNSRFVGYTHVQAYSHVVSGPIGHSMGHPSLHPVMSYNLVFPTPSVSSMVGHGSESNQGVRPAVSSFSTPTSQVYHSSGSSFPPMPVSFMTRPAMSYVDGVNSGQEGDDRLVNASGSGRDLSMGQPSCSHREPADRIGTTSGSSPACVGSSPEMVLGQINNSIDPVLTHVQPNEEEGNTRLSLVYSPCFGQDEGVDSYLLGQVNVFPREVDDSVVEAVVCSNPEIECSGSNDKNMGVDSALISSQRADDEVP
ncbi:hypothetical protein V6N11_033401 [Hibiscus sabdariffa]|uniref:Uncharacterized protein n=1 Tax=Hibiscus sabdariffa TaxID=183260 RepID=A0ABR2PYN8_9ROSI